MDVPTTQAYVCRLQSRRHIEIRALNEGYLEEIPVPEGQAVRAGDRLYELYPVLYRAKPEAEKPSYASLRSVFRTRKNSQGAASCQPQSWPAPRPKLALQASSLRSTASWVVNSCSMEASSKRATPSPPCLSPDD